MRTRIKKRVNIANEVAVMTKDMERRRSVFNELVLPRVKYYIAQGKTYATAKKFAMAEINLGIL